jgi:hypothetical protein
MADHGVTKSKPVRLSAEQARGGRIVLNTPWRRAVFVGGLAGLVVLFVVLIVLAG